jgi:hypothetical protein
MPLIIRITRGFAGGRLTLRLLNGHLAFDVQARPGSTIHWQPDPSSNVVIEEISEKKDYPKVFVDNPSELGASGIFEGVLIDSNHFRESEYYIKWHFRNPRGASETFDPVMSINPSLPPTLIERYIIPALSPVFAFFATVLSVIVLRRMINMNADLTGAKNELSNVKNELSNVKDELSNVKGELSNVKGEISGVRGEISEVKNKMER